MKRSSSSSARKGCSSSKATARRTGRSRGRSSPAGRCSTRSIDPRDGTIHAATNNEVYGATTHRSADRGQTWARAEELGLPEDTGLTLEKTWHIEPGRDGEDGRLWLGGAPGVLFRTDDGGRGLAAGGRHRRAPRRATAGSRAPEGCAVTRSRSIPRSRSGCTSASRRRESSEPRTAAETWTPANRGTAADFLPDPFPELGQCVHKLLVHPARPRRPLWQEPLDVYRSDDRGEHWERLEAAAYRAGSASRSRSTTGIPTQRSSSPEESAENRVTCDGRLGVCRTDDAGASWSLLAGGLPRPAWGAVMREELLDRLDPAGIYLGTQSSSLFVSPDAGETWIDAASQLPPILSVEAVEWR